jgi:hypothetical protein
MQLAGAGLRASQALYVAAKLGIADHLATKALTSSELAVLTGTHGPSLTRLLRALVAFGVFIETEVGRFALTPAGQLLRSDVSTSLRSTVLFLTGEVRWRCWADLLTTVRTGAAAAERVLGMPVFDYYARNPEDSQIHDEAMAEMTRMASVAILQGYDFSRFRCVVDVGGGSGQFLSAILDAHTALRGILFDLPFVVESAQPILARPHIRERCKIDGGSFFENVPRGGDAYVLKQIIHDWDDERASTILSACRQAMTSDATLLIVDRLLPEHAEPGHETDVYVADLEMLTMTPGGKERTETEFKELLDQTGFVLQRAVRTRAPLAVIEAQPK